MLADAWGDWELDGQPEPEADGRSERVPGPTDTHCVVVADSEALEVTVGLPLRVAPAGTDAVAIKEGDGEAVAALEPEAVPEAEGEGVAGTSR